MTLYTFSYIIVFLFHLVSKTTYGSSARTCVYGLAHSLAGSHDLL